MNQMRNNQPLLLLCQHIHAIPHPFTISDSRVPPPIGLHSCPPPPMYQCILFYFLPRVHFFRASIFPLSTFFAFSFPAHQMHPPASSTNDGRRPPSSPFLLFLLLLLIAASLPASIMALQCFECFDRNQPCTRFSNCTGSACVLYENMPNRTSVAFCLLATAERQDEQMAQGCWRDGDSKGVECLCTSDFCNAPRDPWTSDPNSAPIPGLKMLDKNPFVDYEYLDEEKAVEGKKNDVGELDDAELPPEGQDQDLMPKQFDDYLDWERRTRNRNQTPKEEEGDGHGPSPSPGSIPPSSSPSVDLPQSDNNGTVIYVEMDNSALVIHRPFLAAWPLAASILLLPHFLSSSNIYYCFFF